MWIVPRQLLTAWNGSSATEATISDLDELSQVCAQSLLARSKRMPTRTWSQKLNRDSWTRFLSGRIVKHSHAKSFGDWWTCSLLRTRAKASVRRVNAKELAILASYGLGLSGQLSLFAPAEFFLRTSLGTSRLDSPQSLATWKAAVTEQRGDYSARRKLAHRTSESGCSSWPTIRASDAEKGGPHQKGSKGDLTLNSAVQNWKTPHGFCGMDKDGNNGGGGEFAKQVQAWATPRASRRGVCEAETLRNSPDLATQASRPTPRASENENRTTRHAPSHGNGHGKTLAGEVNANLALARPTPAARDSKGANGPEHFATKDRPHADQLANAVVLNGQQDPESSNTNGKRCGQLNPDWVSQLMGVPVGWVDVEATRELINFDFWEMGVFQQQLQERGKF